MQIRIRVSRHFDLRHTTDGQEVTDKKQEEGKWKFPEHEVCSNELLSEIKRIIDI